MSLEQRLAVLEASPVPTWVMDPEQVRICWANDKALEFWRAADRADLFARDFGASSPTSHIRLRTAVAAIRDGRTVQEEYTFYPRGQPVTVRLYRSGVELDDGRIGLLQQAFVKDEVDPELLRSL